MRPQSLLAGLLALAGCAEIVAAAETDPIDCLVSPSRIVQVAFAVSGVIADVAVERGASVKAGERLAELDSGVEAASVAIAEARAASVAGVEAAQLRIDAARRKLDRARALLNKQVAAAQTVEDAKTEYDAAVLELQNQKDRRALDALELERARKLLDQRRLVSPIEAVVVDRHVSPGEYVERQAVLTLAAIDPITIDIVAPAPLFGQFKIGDNVSVGLEFPAGKEIEARVSVLDPFIDAASGTFRARLSAPNSARAIVAGFRCKVLPATR
jgi:RND family efflux transporter MFP subunit